MNNFKLSKNKEWKEVEVNGEIKEIPNDWNMKKVEQLTICLDNKRKPLNQGERSLQRGNVPYWGANSIVDYVKDYLIDEDVILLGEDAAPFYDKTKKVSFISKGKIWPNNHIHVLKPLNNMINGYFLMTILNIIKYEKIIGVESRPKLTQKMMNSIDVLLPSINQQSSIASILSAQESIINDMETLVEKYETRLRYLSEELLSGRLRIKEVDGKTVFYKNKDWKEVEINGEIKKIPKDWDYSTPKNSKFNIKTGNKDANAAIKNGAYPFFTCSANEIFKIDTYCFDTEAILISGNGSTLGEVKYYKGKFDAYQRTYVINEIKNIKFIFLYFKKYFKDSLHIIGGSIPFIKIGDIENFFIALPTDNEQILISQFLEKKEKTIIKQKELLSKEKLKFEWLLENLLSGNYLVEENIIKE